MSPPRRPTHRRIADWLVDAGFRGLIWLARRLPYEQRVPAGGWVFSRLIAPLAGYRRRVRENLALIFPDMPRAEVQRLCRAVPDHVGRNLIELYSPREFLPRATSAPCSGPGMEALIEAHGNDRSVFLVSGHFGSFNAARAAVAARGIELASLYRPLNNRFFNKHYVAAIGALSAPIYPRSREGMFGFIRHLRAGGVAAILLDQRMAHGRPLSFFGHRAWTALSAAEMALKFDALLIPVYGVRKENGLDFEVTFEAPIPHSTPEDMTQALNDSLEAMVRRHMDQWFWIHRRWATPKAHHLPAGASDAARSEPKDR
jgi:KDO2-lipid IV(A) lauroyltransferase